MPLFNSANIEFMSGLSGVLGGAAGCSLGGSNGGEATPQGLVELTHVGSKQDDFLSIFQTKPVV